jgi:DNA-binding NarL/FixJ family response regulator
MQKIRLIIADCHELFMKGLHDLIDRQDDFDCIAIAGSAKETLRLISELKPDILLLDICLLESGIDSLLSSIKSSSPETQTVVLTHSIKQGEIADSFHAGVVGYLTKDIGEEQLISSLRTVHTGQEVLSPEVAQLITEAGQIKGLADESSPLSDRELEIMKMVAEAKTNRKFQSNSIFLNIQ